MRARVFKRLIAMGALGTSCLLPSACLVNDDSSAIEPLVDPEPPPPPPAIRIVHDAALAPETDGGTTGTESGDPSGSTPLSLPRCKTKMSTNCCATDGTPPGLPDCAWKLIAPGESVTITQALSEPFQLGKPYEAIDLPASLELVNLTGAQVNSYQECSGGRSGFRLTGPGLNEDRMADAFVSEWAIHEDGTWHGVTAGSYTVQTWDTAAQHLFPPNPAPGGRLAPLCDYAVQNPQTKWLVHVVYQIDFEMNGTKYYHAASKFAPVDNAVHGYYFAVEKTY